MAMCATLYLLVALATFSTGNFIETPASVNATLGSQVQFNCRISTGILYWLINGDELWEPTNSNRGAEAYTENNRVSTLTIPAQLGNDNATIYCAIHPNNQNTTAVLRIQGILNAVANLQAISESDGIEVTWMPPETLNITDIEPDISHYIVTVHNEHTGYDEAQTVNKTEYSFRPIEVDECKPYRIVVEPVNVVGIGTASDPIYAVFSEPTLEVNTKGWLQNNQVLISATCKVVDNRTIAWRVQKQSSNDTHLFLGKAETLFVYNSFSGEYSETVECNANMQGNMSIQCLGMRVCSLSDSDPCVTSICSSNVIPLPNTTILEDLIVIDQEVTSTITKTSNIHQITTNGSAAASSKISECQTTIVALSASFGGSTLVLVAIAMIYCCCYLIKIRSSNIKIGKEPVQVSLEERVYESVLSIPGAHKHYSPTSTVVSTHVCPAYEVHKSTHN